MHNRESRAAKNKNTGPKAQMYIKNCLATMRGSVFAGRAFFCMKARRRKFLQKCVDCCACLAHSYGVRNFGPCVIKSFCGVEIETDLLNLLCKSYLFMAANLKPNQQPQPLPFQTQQKIFGKSFSKGFDSTAAKHEGSGLFKREVCAEVLPKAEYSLTALEESLTHVLHALQNWGEEYKLKCDGK